jgi:2-phospho-L-lactate guanylyltransferase
LRTLAIVPVKAFVAAKQRLADALARGSRASLAQAMFSDVLASLTRAEAVDAIAVVTNDLAAETLALGVATILHDEAEAGQSQAAEIGLRHAQAGRVDRALLVPGDTPLIDPVEVDALLERTAREGVAVGIVSDRHGTGTNALVLNPPDAIAPAFGPDSLQRHVAAAETANRTHRVEPCESLAHDVDTPEDLVELLAVIQSTSRGAQRTRGALAQLERTGSLRALAGARSLA